MLWLFSTQTFKAWANFPNIVSQQHPAFLIPKCWVNCGGCTVLHAPCWLYSGGRTVLRARCWLNCVACILLVSPCWVLLKHQQPKRCSEAPNLEIQLLLKEGKRQTLIKYYVLISRFFTPLVKIWVKAGCVCWELLEPLPTNKGEIP